MGQSGGYRYVLLCAALVSMCATTEAASPQWRDGLSDREIAIQRWFSWITFLQDRQETPWPVWYTDADQLGATSLRYQLAFAGYGCAAMAAKAPAYHELAQRQLHDICERLIDVRTWYYITHYWDYGSNPPDPCLCDNVMYTGHLTQLMCLYELMTGDLRYSESGWDFVWQDGRKTHYTLAKAVERMYDMSVASPGGGICCEPGMVFIVCNDHSAATFLMHDLLHGTNFADANTKWFNWMSKNFRQQTPNCRDYFSVMYYEKLQVFAPISDVGSDAWALAWGYPWFPNTTLAHEGWEQIKKHADWQSPQPDQLFAKGNRLLSCCVKATIPLRNAFLPLVAVQAEGAASPIAKKLLRWFEAEHGKAVDTDGDGHDDAYCYDTDKGLRAIVTGNIAAALATDGDSMRQLFRTSRTSILAAPTLAHVDYPNVSVRTAEFIDPVLRFTVLKGKPDFSGKTELVCSNVAANYTLTRDGQPYDDCQKTDSTVVISTDVDQEHVFELTVSQ